MRARQGRPWRAPGLLLPVLLPVRLPGLILCLLLCTATGTDFAHAADRSSRHAAAGDAAAAPAAVLRARFVAMRAQLAGKAFQRPLVLQSSDIAEGAMGEVHALIDTRFDTLGAVIAEPGEWCELLLLVITVKQCRVSSAKPNVRLSVWFGTSRVQPLTDSMRVDLAFHMRQKSADYLRVDFDADAGPVGTRDYRIALEAIPMEDGKTFIRFAYSFNYNTFGRVAIEAYLATLGRGKVGFSVEVPASPAAGEPARLIGGVRGIVERNTMRYYLAIEAYLGALSAPPQSRFENRIRAWYAAAQRYPRQLHDVDEADYLDMKREEHRRQRTAPAPATLSPGV